MSKTTMYIGTALVLIGFVGQFIITLLYRADAERTNRPFFSFRFFGWVFQELQPVALRAVLISMWLGCLIVGIGILFAYARTPTR